MNNKENILFDARMEKRANSSPNITFPEIFQIIQTYPVPETSYKILSSFFHYYSVTDYIESEQIVNILFGYLNSNDLNMNLHGVRSVYCIICHKPFKFNVEFVQKLCNKLITFLFINNANFIISTLNVLHFISIDVYENT